MADLTIRIPPQHIDAVRDGLLHRLSAVADALHHAAGELAVRTHGEDDVRAHRVELADLEAALEQIGWDYESTDDAVELTAHPEVLSDALRQATTDALDALGRLVATTAGTDADAAAARELLTAAHERLELFVEVYWGDAW